ncbi:translation initiation factor IF-2 subunit beta [Candidatus Woesearchaeota archaeon]|nr:translation initiation factor IF-2 subunit beta [Candidatus Woesearchaeota archaeon]
MDYEKLLEEARKKLPESTLKHERFEVPKVRGHIQGNRTILSNFYQIAETLGREPEHLLKYILKELATPGELKKNAVIIGAKVPASRINQRIEEYAETFVICPECKRPDTKLIREDGFVFMKCLACGAKKNVRGKG